MRLVTNDDDDDDNDDDVNEFACDDNNIAVAITPVTRLFTIRPWVTVTSRGLRLTNGNIWRAAAYERWAEVWGREPPGAVGRTPTTEPGWASTLGRGRRCGFHVSNSVFLYFIY